MIEGYLMTNFLINLFVKDNTSLIANPNRRIQYGVLSGCVGIVCNLFLFIIKVIAGLITSSVAITADAFNNLSDAGSSIVTLFGFKLANKPADKEHPFGHGRIEYIAGFIVSVLIIIVGIELIKTSIIKIISPHEIFFSLISVIIMFVSIGIKLWMSLFNKKLGCEIDSSTILAVSADSLNDVFATSAVIISMLLNKFFNLNIDGIIGVAVALFILYSGFNTAKDTLNPLLGEPPDPTFVKEIEKIVLSYKNVIGVHDLIIHSYGANIKIISLHVEVPSDVNILEIHDTIDNIEKYLNNKFNCESIIHMDPLEINNEVINCINKKVIEIIKKIDSDLSLHDFRLISGPTHKNVVFDLVVPQNFRLSNEELLNTIDFEIKKIDTHYNTIVNIDNAYSINI